MTTDVSLPADSSIGRVVRGTIRDTLRRCGMPDEVAERAMIVATELASNALLHAAPPYRMRLSTDQRTVHIAIGDSLALTPSLRQYDVLAVTGRGLRLVADCSTSWGVRSRSDGKEVWAEVPLVGDPFAEEPPEPSMQRSGHPDFVDTAGSDGEHDGLGVRFLAVPVDTYLALQEWNDAIVRECELIAALDSSPPDLPARLLELAVRLSGQFASPREGYRDTIAHARTEGTAVVDLDRRWPRPVDAAVDAADAFLAMMEELDGFCHTDMLLSEAAAPDVVRLRRWFVTELRAQLVDHQAPIPFDRTDDRRPV